MSGLAPFADAPFLPLTVVAIDFTFTPAGGVNLTVSLRRLTHFLAAGIEISFSAVTVAFGSPVMVVVGPGRDGRCDRRADGRVRRRLGGRRGGLGEPGEAQREPRALERVVVRARRERGRDRVGPLAARGERAEREPAEVRHAALVDDGGAVADRDPQRVPDPRAAGAGGLALGRDLEREPGLGRARVADRHRPARLRARPQTGAGEDRRALARVRQRHGAAGAHQLERRAAVGGAEDQHADDGRPRPGS